MSSEIRSAVVARRGLTATLVSMAILSGSCGDGGLHQIVIAIDTELCEPGDGASPDFDRLEVHVDGVAEPICAVFGTSAAGCVTVSSTDMPLVLPILSESGTGEADVTVELLDGGAVVGCGTGTVSFQAETTIWAALTIRRACGVPSCTAESLDVLEGVDSEADLPDAITCGPPSPAPRTPIDRIAAGDAHACLVDADGRLFCWGANDRGQLGVNDLANRTRPTLVALPSGRTVEHVEAGKAHTCAVLVNGPSRTVSCWGDNRAGQVGNGSFGEEAVRAPASVSGTTGAREVSLGPEHSCARLELSATERVVACWGSNGAGEVSGAPGEAVLAPARVAGITAVDRIAAGGNNQAEPARRHTCAVGEDDGGVAGTFCWGSNSDGQLGVVAGTGPGPVDGAPAFVSLALGSRESCGADDTGAMWCWGLNVPPGTLGFPRAESEGLEMRTTASAVPFPETVLAPPAASRGGPPLSTLAAGDSYRCFLDPSGRPLCLGNNSEGRLGSAAASTSTPVPVDVTAGITFEQIVVGSSFGCALPSDGAMPFCWGLNNQGQLGLGTAAGSAAPAQIPTCE